MGPEARAVRVKGVIMWVLRLDQLRTTALEGQGVMMWPVKRLETGPVFYRLYK